MKSKSKLTLILLFIFAFASAQTVTKDYKLSGNGLMQHDFLGHYLHGTNRIWDQRPTFNCLMKPEIRIMVSFSDKFL